MAKNPLDVILSEISCALLSLQQESLFEDFESKHRELSFACEKYLKHRGFVVVPPNTPKYKIKKLDDLIHLFYAFSDNKHPELMNSYRNLDRDRKIASSMVKARMDARGCSIEVARAECAEIIETIFLHEKDFNFKIPISFGILGQKNCGWITDKAIQIINRKRLNAEKERSDEYLKKLDEKYDAEPDGFGDLNEILGNLD